MATTPNDRASGEAPRTDLPPLRDAYDDGYFGTDEEEGVVREREATGEDDPERAEERAGGDREI